MIFIIGGSYQGKREFACEQYHLTCDDVLVCTEEMTEIDFSKPIIANIERFALGCVRRGQEPKEYWMQHETDWANKILISDDISCGVVPIDTTIRAWREASGRANNYLAGKSDHAWRVFCGLGDALK